MGACIYFTYLCPHYTLNDKLPMQKESQKVMLLRWATICSDLVVLNVLLTVFYVFAQRLVPPAPHEEIHVVYFAFNVIYLFCVSWKKPVLYMRKVRPEQIVGRAFITVLWFAIFSFLIVNYLTDDAFSWEWALCFYPPLWIGVLISRLLMRAFISRYRRMGRNVRNVVFVGSGLNMIDLYGEMMGDPSTGYRVLGYFDDQPAEHFRLPYLGTVADVIPYLKKMPISPTAPPRLYCCLPSVRADEIVQLINFCENHLIRFCSVPNVRNYLRRSMRMELMGDVPVLYLREEPLRQPLNRFIKRAFDVAFSLTFLCTLFPFIYIFVAIVTKITSPGPVFFKQKRNGLNGKEFYCYKFRSMKVNKDADTLQATKDDPRKTKFGDFLRRSSIDELPQFINVLKGDMSVVGPRPHMLKHTEEYSALINKYMVRHFLKPGITGWAQVNGCRGETKELSQMEDRIRKDIWYVENWSFWLDLRIIYMTVRNAIRGEANAY